MYLNGQTGNDANDGTSVDRALKTFQKAREKAMSIQTVNTIYVTNTVDISGDISLKGTNAVIKRYPSFNGYLFNVKGTATLSDITIDGNSENCPDTEKALVEVLHNQQLNIQDGTVLENNKIKRPAHDIYQAKGGAVYVELGTLNMSGGIIQNNQASFGGGVLLNYSVMNMSGGIIRNNRVIDAIRLSSQDTLTSSIACGGGIGAYVQGIYVSDRDRMQSVINLSGGWIQNNFSEGDGGGISLSCLDASNGQNILNMTGGRIDGNQSNGTGAGIFVQAGLSESTGSPSYSVATISGGYITNNQMLGKSNSNFAFGGGGIYVNGYSSIYSDIHNGVLYLYNAIITDNTAEMDGGGYASCPVSVTEVHLKNGVALYGNHADNANEMYILASNAYGYHSGNPEYSIVNAMLGGHPYNWKYQDGTLVPHDKLEGFLKAIQFESLSLHTDEQADANALALAKVWITGNTSATRGGGIGSNGTVIMRESETTKVNVEKRWDDQQDASKRPSRVEVDLYRTTDGSNEAIYVGYGYIQADADGNWHYVFTNLPAKTEEGLAYHYTVKEKPLDGYMYTMTGTQEDGYVMTNHLSTMIHVKKVWVGQKENAVKIELLANGQKTNQLITLSDTNQWQGSFIDLRKYDENGQLIQYTIDEVSKDGRYDVSISGNMEDGFIITNKEKEVPPTEEKEVPPTSTETKVEPKQNPDVVQTSASMDTIFYGSALLIAGFGVYVLRKMQQTN